MARKIAVDSRAVPYALDYNSESFFEVENVKTGYALYAKKGLRIFSLVENYMMAYKPNVGYAYFKFEFNSTDNEVSVTYVAVRNLPKEQAEKACKIIDAIQLLSSEEFM
jgi:hypothetical protein